jgi:hypothetical protein
MDAAWAAECHLTPEAADFVRFCYGRRKVGWPELYDEMCAVASRGLFRGWGPDDLAEHGIGFGLFELPALAGLVARVVAEQPPVATRRCRRVEPGQQARPATLDEAADDDRHEATPVLRPRFAAATP